MNLQTFTYCICTATPAFLCSTDRKWIYAKYTMQTQKKDKREPRAATLEQYLSMDAIFDPCQFSLDTTFNIMEP